MKLLTPIHLLGVALFFSMVSNSHGQDALNPIAKGAPHDSRSAFHSPSQPTGGKIPFFTRWLSAVGPETQVCQDGTLIDSDDGGLGLTGAYLTDVTRRRRHREWRGKSLQVCANGTLDS